MNKLASLTLGLAMALTPLAAAAQNFDGSKPLLCSSIETIDCEPGAECIKGLARDIDAPQFFFLDFEKKVARTISASGEERTTEIGGSLSDSGELIIQGAQLGRAWSVTIGQDNGEMVLAVAGDGVAFIIFGACTPM